MQEQKKVLDNELELTLKWLTHLEIDRQACISLQALLDNCDGIQGIRYNGMPSQGKIGDPTAVIGLKRFSLETKLKNARCNVTIVEGALSTLKNNERLILERRYVYGMQWDKVAEASMYSRKQAYNIAKKGLEKMRKALFGSD